MNGKFMGLKIQNIVERVDFKGELIPQITFLDRICIYRDLYANASINLLNLILILAKTEKHIIINLKDTKIISASGAVALFSYITYAQINYKEDLFTIHLPNDRALVKRIRDTGLWDAIRSGGKRKLDKLWESNSKFQSGYIADTHFNKTIEALDKYKNVPHRLKEAINEAILNISHHAYHDNSKEFRWWQYCSQNPSNKSFIFVICDKGITIPKKFLTATSAPDRDTIPESIAYAMKEGTTSTGCKWRGKGSVNIKKPVESDDRDLLIVVSGNGIYKYNSKIKSEEKQYIHSAFDGTLIAWNFDFDEA